MTMYKNNCTFVINFVVCLHYPKHSDYDQTHVKYGILSMGNGAFHLAAFRCNIRKEGSRWMWHATNVLTKGSLVAETAYCAFNNM